MLQTQLVLAVFSRSEGGGELDAFVTSKCLRTQKLFSSQIILSLLYSLLLSFSFILLTVKISRDCVEERDRVKLS